MSNEAVVNNGRRQFLIAATSAVSGVGAVGVAVPFLASWNPSAKARAVGAPITVDVSSLEPGEMIGPIPSWRGKPVFIIRRTPEVMERLQEETGFLRDPDSTRPQQPEYATNYYRARESNPEICVLIGICTHLGCVPSYFPQVEAQPFDPNWRGGFFCPCHGSKFDLAGRVYTGVPAAANLEVPPYSYESPGVITVGVDEETA